MVCRDLGLARGWSGWNRINDCLLVASAGGGGHAARCAGIELPYERSTIRAKQNERWSEESEELVKSKWSST